MELLRSSNEFSLEEFDEENIDYNLYENVSYGLGICCFQLGACCKNV